MPYEYNIFSFQNIYFEIEYYDKTSLPFRAQGIPMR